MIRYLLPLAFFIGLIILFLFGLQNDPRKIPSPFINKPAPTFNLPTLHTPKTNISLGAMEGKVSLINVWASWCVACRAEHPLLIEAMSTNKGLNLYGLNYRDKRSDALQWLGQLGNPYIESAYDEAGTTGIDYGVYGVPETFILDKKSIIRYKHIGPVDKETLEEIIFPLIKCLENDITPSFECLDFVEQKQS